MLNMLFFLRKKWSFGPPFSFQRRGKLQPISPLSVPLVLASVLPQRGKYYKQTARPLFFGWQSTRLQVNTLGFRLGLVLGLGLGPGLSQP